MKKRWIVFTVLLIVALTVFLYIRFFFVFGEGVKSGELNYVVYKGLIFKTYEGKLIQSGIRSKTAGTIQSYEFEFSVENEALARKLMLLGGKNIELHYKEYFGALPWRGFSKFVVDSIVTKPIDSLPIGPTPESADSTHVASFPTLHRFVLASDTAQQPIPLHPASAVRISGPGAASLLVRTEGVDRRTLCG